MRFFWMTAVVLVSALSIFGTVSEDLLKDLARLVEIDSIRDYEDDNGLRPNHILKVDFATDPEGFENVFIRIAVEMTDRKTKKTYLAEETRKYGRIVSDTDQYDDYSGEGYWEFRMPYGSFDKLKVTAYVVQHGVMDGGEFVPFETECDDVKSYSELVERTSVKFPEPVSLGRTILVYD